MNFSHRVGAVSQKLIQLGTMDNSLRNRLYNAINEVFPKKPGYYTSYDGIRKHVLDKLGFNTETATNYDFNEYFLNGEWFVPYDIIELIIEFCGQTPKNSLFPDLSDINKLIGKIQIVLEEEKSGYRLVNNQFVANVNKEELDTLEKSSNTRFDSINTHIRKAISLYSDRKNPDYENSIKESISAVEAICCIITGLQGGQATLGKLLKVLEGKGIVIHKALHDAFGKLYGFTSDQSGIRHGGVNFTDAPAEDAKFMLISCSAFINYLIEKLSKLEEQPNA